MDQSHNSADRPEVRIAQVAEAIKEKAERDVLRANYTSVFEMSPLVDRFAPWLWSGVGATAALMVANIESITRIIPFAQVKFCLGILTVSGLFGFLEKFLALDIQSTAAQEAKLREILQESSQEFYRQISELKLAAAAQNIDISSEIDTKKALDKFADAHPWYKRIWFKRRIKAEDAQKVRLRRYYRQLIYAVLEFFGFMAFILIVVKAI
jgi:hypothetical protein